MAEQQSYKLNRTKLVVVIAGGLTLLLVLFFTFRKKKSEVKDVIVDIQHIPNTENDLIKEKDVKEIVRRAFEEKVENEQLGQVDVARIEQVLEQDPFIENAETFVLQVADWHDPLPRRLNPTKEESLFAATAHESN